MFTRVPGGLAVPHACRKDPGGEAEAKLELIKIRLSFGRPGSARGCGAATFPFNARGAGCSQRADPGQDGLWGRSADGFAPLIGRLWVLSASSDPARAAGGWIQREAVPGNRPGILRDGWRSRHWVVLPKAGTVGGAECSIGGRERCQRLLCSLISSITRTFGHPSRWERDVSCSSRLVFLLKS